MNTNNKCTGVSSLCANYSSSTGLCTSCYNGYGLTPDGKCDASYIQDPNCKVLGLNGGCRECARRFYVSIDGKCKGVNPLCR